MLRQYTYAIPWRYGIRVRCKKDVKSRVCISHSYIENVHLSRFSLRCYKCARHYTGLSASFIGTNQKTLHHETDYQDYACFRYNGGRIVL